MNDSDREFAEDKDRMYWTIGLIGVLAVMAFVASLYAPLLREAFNEAYQQALNSIL